MAEFYSHPGKTLKVHIKEVSHLATLYSPEQYRQAAYVAGITHDFGKFTTYFQKYLGGSKSNSKYKQHGFISALLGAYCAFQQWGEESLLPLVIYSAIYHHHGNLTSFRDILPETIKNFGDKIENNLVIAYSQLEDIKANLDSVINDYSGLIDPKVINGFVLDPNLELLLRRLLRIEYQYSINEKYKAQYCYLMHQFIYSSLIAADKISASGAIPPAIRVVPSIILSQQRERYINSVQVDESKTHINKIRQAIFNRVQNNMNKWAKEAQIFTITSPTGSGKTLTGFYAAAYLRETLSVNRKIVYILPFTSIIDQNYDVIDTMLRGIEGYEQTPGSYLIKHHHLAGWDSEGSEDTINPDSILFNELIAEDWHSGIIVTTFVQFFESLISKRNKMLKKFHSFKDSIFLIDEIQALDIRYYPLVEYLIGRLCREFDCRIILMTATKPAIFSKESGSELTGAELLDNYEDYYRCFNRTRISPRLEKIELNDFVKESYEIIINHRSTMVVCNTIDSSLHVYAALKELLTDGTKMYYLSTNLVPIQRRKRIEEISSTLSTGKKIVLVSTQVVEAGVDLDFDAVIRDFSPIDSIIQCAGRCNRHGIHYSDKQGNVYIYLVVNDSGKSYGSFIYGDTNLIISYDLLEGRMVIEEKDFLNLIDNYYRTVRDNISTQRANSLIKSLETFDMSSEGIGGFSLIKNNPGYIDVMFRLNEESEQAYHKLWEIIKIKNYKEKRKQYLAIKNTIKMYTISLPKKYLTCFKPESMGENNIFISLPLEGCQDYYNYETGFTRTQQDDYLFF